MGKNPLTPNNRNLSVLGVKYGTAGQIARNTLIAKGWTISGDIYDVTCNSNLGIDNLNKESTFTTYPNPTKNILNFSEKLSEINVLDVGGRIVFSNNAEVNDINIEKLQKGVYLLTGKDKDGNTFSTKFIKE